MQVPQKEHRSLQTSREQNQTNKRAQRGTALRTDVHDVPHAGERDMNLLGAGVGGQGRS